MEPSRFDCRINSGSLGQRAKNGEKLTRRLSSLQIFIYQALTFPCARSPVPRNNFINIINYEYAVLK